MYSALPYLTRRGDVFYFRRAIPVQLTAQLQRKEWKVSLKTSDRDLARLRCRECSNAFDRIMVVVNRMPSVGAKEINRLLRNFFEQLLSEGEDIVDRIRNDDQLNNLEEAEGAEPLIEVYQSEIASDKFTNQTKATAIEVLTSAGLDRKDIGIEGFETICRGILRAKSEQMRITSAMLRGAYDQIESKDPLFEGVVSPGPIPLAGESTQAKVENVSSVIENYIENRSASEWTLKTTGENRRVLGWFLDQIGNSRKLKDVTADDVRTFRDLIAKLPKSFTIRVEYANLTLPEAAKKGMAKEKLSAATQIKYLGVIKAFLAWCEDEYSVDMSQALRIKGPKKKNLHDARHPFSNDQLNTIFHSPQYTGHKSASRRSSSGDLVIRDGKFWLPVLGLITGARLPKPF